MGGSVEQRAAWLFFLAEHANEVAVEQVAEHRSAIDTSDVIDFGTSHRLPVRDDRERFELLPGHADWFLPRDVSHGRGELWIREERPATVRLDELDAARLVLLRQLVEEGRKLLALGFRLTSEVPEHERRVRRKEDCLQGPAQVPARQLGRCTA